jgi:hypothetical protein
MPMSRSPVHVPILERLAVSIPEAVMVSGRSKSRLYQDMKAGRLEFRKNGRSTLILVRSLKRLVEGDSTDS